MEIFRNVITKFIQNTGIVALDLSTVTMLLIACLLLYLAIAKRFEPLLLLPIAFGMLLANMPLMAGNSKLIHPEWYVAKDGLNLSVMSKILHDGGLLDMLYLGVKLGLYPPLIFLGVGAMTDFSPLIANPKTILLGAAAQFGVFITFLGALLLGRCQLIGWGVREASSIAIIGGADGPTSILLAKLLAPQLLPAIAIAAYCYMALIPIIQPPIMKCLTTKAERNIIMERLRPVSKIEKIIFPIAVTMVVSLILPDAIPLVGMLMLGNLARECGVVDRISKTAQNSLINIITIFLGLSVGSTATADAVLNPQAVGIVLLGVIAFCFSTAGGVIFGKIMCKFSGGKINPLIGAAGVSAVPMAARVAQSVGQKENPSNFLLMHAMGPNVAGVIGSAVAAGVFLALYK